MARQRVPENRSALGIVIDTELRNSAHTMKQLNNLEKSIVRSSKAAVLASKGFIKLSKNITAIGSRPTRFSMRE